MKKGSSTKVFIFLLLAAALLIFAGATPQCSTTKTDVYNDASGSITYGNTTGVGPDGGYNSGHAVIGSSAFGVVASSSSGFIGIIDPATQTVTAPLLYHQLGSIGGSLFDVVITPDGQTTMVSNFGDSRINFIDTSDPSSPWLIDYLIPGTPDDFNDDGVFEKWEVDPYMFIEDMAVTPDGQYLLTSDGGFSPRILVIDIPSRTVVDVFNEPAIYHNAIAVAPNGVTVLTADYFQGMIYGFTLDNAGQLTFMDATNVTMGKNPDDTWIFRPVNIGISPDGKTAIAAGPISGYTDPDFEDPFCDGRADCDENWRYSPFFLPVLTITGPGTTELTDKVDRTGASMPLTGTQTVVFNYDGTKAYLQSTQKYYDPNPLAPWAVVEAAEAGTYAVGNYMTAAEPQPQYPPDGYLHYRPNQLVTLNIPAPGRASLAGEPVAVDFYGTSQLFGVDNLAMCYGQVTRNVPQFQHLYISNPTLSGASTHIQVMDVTTGAIIKTINFEDIVEPAGCEYYDEAWGDWYPCPCREEVSGCVSIPTGLYFQGVGN